MHDNGRQGKSILFQLVTLISVAMRWKVDIETMEHSQYKIASSICSSGANWQAGQISCTECRIAMTSLSGRLRLIDCRAVDLLRWGDGVDTEKHE